MLALDSLVIDLIFQKGAELDPDAMVEALGGVDIAQSRNILDPDMQDPRFEMELSPSMPFRRRGERRLLIVDGSVAPMRKDPRSEPVIKLDLSAEKDRLIALCEAAPVRLGRISALGSWGDAVMVARDARDMRAMALLSWMLDPSVDAEGRKRGGRLSQSEMEHKLGVYDKRIEERGQKTILDNLPASASLERKDDLLIVSVLSDDGTWDLRNSLELERSLAAVESFSMIPGARLPGDVDEEPEPEAEPAAVGAVDEDGKPPVALAEDDGTLMLIFPKERFDLDVAAALGRKDYDRVLRGSDQLSGQQRDHLFQHGAGFIAPVEFLSEVFVDGKPLTKPQFEQTATDEADGVRSLNVHCPRFGRVLLLDVPERGRFIAAGIKETERIIGLLPAQGGP